jgi:hypothetical protein
MGRHGESAVFFIVAQCWLAKPSIGGLAILIIPKGNCLFPIRMLADTYGKLPINKAMLLYQK